MPLSRGIAGYVDWYRAEILPSRSAICAVPRLIAAGFTHIGRGSWSGGESYLRNLLSKVQAKLFLEQHSSIGGRFDLILVYWLRLLLSMTGSRAPGSAGDG